VTLRGNRRAELTLRWRGYYIDANATDNHFDLLALTLSLSRPAPIGRGKSSTGQASGVLTGRETSSGRTGTVSAPKQEPVQQSDQTIKTVVNLVDVLFTVLNRRNKLVPELEKGDFKIWDYKAPQEIRYFSRQSDLPRALSACCWTHPTASATASSSSRTPSINFLFSVLRHNKDELCDDLRRRTASRPGLHGRRRSAAGTRSTKTRAGAAEPQSTTRFMKRA